MIGRRAFVGGGVALGALSSFAGLRAADADTGLHSRIAISTSSFRQRFRQTGKDAPSPLSLVRFPRFVRDEVGLAAVELWSVHFERLSVDYCRSLRMAAHAARARIVNIQLDDPSIDLADPNDVARAGSIGRVKQWMDRAALCGSPSLRTNVNINPPTQPIELDRVIASFAELARYGRRIGVVILVENHLGYTASIDRTIAVVSGVDDPWCRAIADWGNSPAADDAERIRDIGRLMPFTYLVSAKSVEFDTVGNHVTFDQAKLVQAAEASGYRGTYSIELYGPKPPPDPVAAARHVASTIAANLR